MEYNSINDVLNKFLDSMIKLSKSIDDKNNSISKEKHKTFQKRVQTIFEERAASNKPENIGDRGEKYVLELIDDIFKEKVTLSNVYLKKENGNYSEIDVLVVSKAGIVVIESKNYSGWIFGDTSKEYWTKTYKNGMKVKFYNPVFQNTGHIKALKNILQDYPNLRYYSMIVFSNHCTVKEISSSAPCPDTYIVNWGTLQKNIKKILNVRPIISEYDRDNILKRLSTYQRKSDIKEQHIKQVNENLKKCPFCSSELIERTNKKSNSTFFGCSAFPKCEYTRN